MTPDAATKVDRLLSIEPRENGVFVATIPPRRGITRLFGGQVAAQALLAACQTVEDGRPPHSLHCYFILPGRADVPVRYEVGGIRDGRSFSTRHVAARQGDVAILELLASFQLPEPGPDWQMPTPWIGRVPPASDGPPHARLGHLAGHLEVRRVNKSNDGWKIHPFWFRTVPPIGDAPALNAAMLTYVSDIALMANARVPGTNEPMAAAASLDHALWFHRPPRVDEWLLFSTESVANIGARGVARGSFHTTEGALVASVTQEALLRPRRARHAPLPRQASTPTAGDATPP